MPNIKVMPTERACASCKQVFLVGGRGRAPKRAQFCSRACARKARIVYSAVPELTPTLAAYIAGLLDGEGSIIQWDRGYGGRLSLRVTISNTDFGILEWLKEVTGTGSIVFQRRAADNVNHSTAGYWALYAQNAVALLKQLLPYLRIKKAHALHAIATQEPPFPRDLYVSPNQNARAERWRALREAKAGGPPCPA